ncbi:Gfo/Idh/MocA family oxidoreductase [Neobacillus sp. PS3-12]|uniref:Gfo/Idh/MocA family protein n=1 Tax=Neobacillus sp. PS3-12 TaxID=3070677 RepID=UPI0027E0DEE7|nr:Gfo/Idh/MocA family oxidoreductase [Neobacillus sp. PS3-12]WML54937.1 Gfo/Idh/MocA family oxidoreductase [Neobacillus sp. PS3-12]
MSKVRVGIIGIGNMGSKHALNIAQGKIEHAELVAVCDTNPDRLSWAKETLGEDVHCFSEPVDLFESNLIDGVIIATPHYDHPRLAIEALGYNIHVLLEKPAGVYTKQVKEMNEVAAKSNKIFSLMLNQRTTPVFKKLKELIETGELGEIKRTNWIMTAWYRPQSYYNSGGWRATWEGEGGGVLLNQDPHILDLWQWTCGLPKRVRAFCSNGKFHDIEVEDDVTAYVEYENGATGVFVTSTGDAPGTNRLEVTGDRGKIVIEDNKLTFWRLTISERQFNREYTGGFGEPEVWKCEVPIKGEATAHNGIIQNWVNTILFDEPLIAPGEEGIKSLAISNAMHLSSWTDQWVELPIDEDLFYEKLQEKINRSTFRKQTVTSSTLNVDGTY